MTYNPLLGRWMEEDPLGFEAGDANLYRYVGNDPTNRVDPSGTMAEPRQTLGTGDYWVPTGIYIATSAWKGYPDPLPHPFIIVDGVGYGFFQVQNNPFGPGRVRNTDNDTYPLKLNQCEIDELPVGAWYSTTDGMIYVNPDQVDPYLFKLAVLEIINDKMANPPDYNIFTNNCRDFVNEVIASAWVAAWNDDFFKHESEWWNRIAYPPNRVFGKLRTDYEEDVGKRVRGKLPPPPPPPPPGSVLGDICGNIPDDSYQPPPPPTPPANTDYDVVDDLNGGWTFVPKTPPPPPVDPYEGVEP